jgi:hypothetical protein
MHTHTLYTHQSLCRATSRTVTLTCVLGLAGVPNPRQLVRRPILAVSRHFSLLYRLYLTGTCAGARTAGAVTGEFVMR